MIFSSNRGLVLEIKLVGLMDFGMSICCFVIVWSMVIYDTPFVLFSDAPFRIVNFSSLIITSTHCFGLFFLLFALANIHFAPRVHLPFKVENLAQKTQTSIHIKTNKQHFCFNVI